MREIGTEGEMRRERERERDIKRARGSCDRGYE